MQHAQKTTSQASLARIRFLAKQSLGTAKRALFGTTAWDRFKEGDWSEEDTWSRCYRAGEHRAIWDHSHPSPELVGYIAGAGLRVGARALDAGCGSGQDAIFLASHQLEVHGLDFSEEAIKIANARNGSDLVSWHLGSILNTPFEPAYFDLITDRGCFHHISGTRRHKYSEEIARILKPGGVLFLRGSRHSHSPFFAVTAETIAAAFDHKLYEVGPALPFYLVTDTGGLRATLVTIVRR